MLYVTLLDILLKSEEVNQIFHEKCPVLKKMFENGSSTNKYILDSLYSSNQKIDFCLCILVY